MFKVCSTLRGSSAQRARVWVLRKNISRSPIAAGRRFRGDEISRKERSEVAEEGVQVLGGVEIGSTVESSVNDCMTD